MPNASKPRTAMTVIISITASDVFLNIPDIDTNFRRGDETAVPVLNLS